MLIINRIARYSKWNTNNIVEMRYIFNGCSSIIILPDISKWKIKNIIKADNIFNGCSSLLSISDISKWVFKNKNSSFISDTLPSFFLLSKITSLNISENNSTSNNENILSYHSEISNTLEKEYKEFNYIEKEEDEKLNDYYDNFYE